MAAAVAGMTTAVVGVTAVVVGVTAVVVGVTAVVVGVTAVVTGDHVIPVQACPRESGGGNPSRSMSFAPKAEIPPA